MQVRSGVGGSRRDPIGPARQQIGPRIPELRARIPQQRERVGGAARVEPLVDGRNDIAPRLVPARTGREELLGAHGIGRTQLVAQHRSELRMEVVATQLGLVRFDKRAVGREDAQEFGRIGSALAHGLPDGARALAVFLVNQREPGERGKLDEQFAFQVELEVKYREGLLGRADRRGPAVHRLPAAG